MANLKISDLTEDTAPLGADLLPIVDTANATTKKVTLANFFNILSSLFTIKDSSDTSKKVAFDVSGVTTGTTRTLTVPNASDTIAGIATPQTFTNKTIGSGTKIAVGAETTGAIYYKDSSGNLTPLTIGSAGQILDVSAGGLPEWIANPSAADASTTVKGVVETATAAEITAGTATGGTGAKLAVTPDQLALSAPTFSGANLTSLPNPAVYKNGTTTKNASDASTIQNIAHGLGVIPKKVKITAIYGASSINAMSESVYNGTTQSSISFYKTNGGTQQINNAFIIAFDASGAGYNTGVITFDATNIIITWTLTGSTASIVYQILWEAEI